MADPVFKYITANPLGLSVTTNTEFVDIDGDGDLDAFSGAGEDIWFFKNTGTVRNPLFADALTNPFGLSNVGYSANPTFVDIEGDGDLDAFVGNSAGNTLFFRNTGTASNPLFSASQANPFGLSRVSGHASPAFVDIDGDGDLDAFVGAGHYNGGAHCFLET